MGRGKEGRARPDERVGRRTASAAGPENGLLGANCSPVRGYRVRDEARKGSPSEANLTGTRAVRELMSSSYRHL